MILSFGVVLNGMIEQPMYDMVLTSRQTRLTEGFRSVGVWPAEIESACPVD